MTLRATTRTLLSKNDGLFQRIVRFNVDILDYMDETHLRGILPLELVRSVSKCPRARARICDYLLGVLELKNSFVLDFEKPCRRVALMEPALVQNLLCYAGAALCWDRIAHVIDRAHLASIKSTLGASAYLFAVKRASFVTGFKSDLPIGQVATNDVGHDAIAAGRECLELAFDGEDEGLLKRFKLKFPSTFEWNFNKGTNDTDKEKAWRYLKRIILKEVAPQWDLYFN